MAIIGLTDRAASFPQIGILRKGAPKPEKGPGRDLRHFRFDTDDADAAARFQTVYGDQPTSIRVYLPFATAAENFEAWQEHWTAGALQHRCDGQTCVLWLQGQRYSQTPVPCPHATLDKSERDRCKPVGRLKVVVPELRRLAYVTVLTGSIHDIIALTEQLSALESLRGDLRGVPMILRRTPREISMPGSNGKRTRMEKWLLSIEAAPSWVDLQLAAQERAALPEGAPARALLPAPPASEATGEVWPDEEEAEPAPAERAAGAAPAPPADNDPLRKDLIAEMRRLAQEARAKGVAVPVLVPRQMTTEQIETAIRELQSLVEPAAVEEPAERAA